MSQVAHQCMKHAGVFLLPSEREASPLKGYPLIALNLSLPIYVPAGWGKAL